MRMWKRELEPTHIDLSEGVGRISVSVDVAADAQAPHPLATMHFSSEQ